MKKFIVVDPIPHKELKTFDTFEDARNFARKCSPVARVEEHEIEPKLTVEDTTNLYCILNRLNNIPKQYGSLEQRLDNLAHDTQAIIDEYGTHEPTDTDYELSKESSE